MENENENVSSPDDALKLGYQLLWLVKKKNKKDAEKLLDGDANIDVSCKDEAGWFAIHYAAAEGYTDVVTALVEMGVRINLKDRNGETPLHKCSRRGHIMCILYLIGHGANISKCDNQGQTPLEIAVKSNKLEVVQLFMKLGAEPTLQDWAWAMDELDASQNEIVDLLINQHNKMPGFKYGSILQTLLYMEEQAVELDNFGVRIILDSTSPLFYIHVCRMTTEYSDIMENLKEEQETFSDSYELTMWGHAKALGMEMELKVTGITECSEKMFAVTLEGKAVNVVKWEKIEDEDIDGGGHTIVTVKFHLEEKKITRFAIVKQTTPEVFTVSSEQTTIKLQMEPDTSIDIPKGTFEKPSEIAVNVVETKDVNKEEEEGQAILMTNVLELTLANKQQPKEPIRIVVPVHSDEIASEGDMVVLASLVEQPEEESDWEVKDATRNPDGKTAFFYVDHFSFYSIAMKAKIIKDKAEVVDALDRSINRKKRVVIFLMTKWVNKISSELVVEFSGVRYVENRVSYWFEAGYDVNTLEKSDAYPIQVGQTFKIKFHGNLVDTSGEEFHEMTFQSNRNNYHVFNIGINDSEEPLEGKLEVLEIREEMVTRKEPDVVKQKGFLCKNQKVERKPMTDTKETIEITESIFNLKVELHEEIEEPEDVIQSDEDEHKPDEQEHRKKFQNLTKTIMKGGKPINVLAIKTSQKRRSRVQ